MNTCQITYTITIPHPHTHLFHVTIDVAGLTRSESDFILPSWTPGSYLIRDYARHVQEFCAEAASTPLRWYKTAKDTWHVEHPGSTEICVQYKVYAHELTVRTSHLDASHGYCNNATVCMYVAERTSEPVALYMTVPRDWRVTTGLEQHGVTPQETSTTWSFIAEDYDELVDCPIECGTHRLFTFTVDTTEHRLAIWGHGNEQEQRLIDDTRKIVETYRDMFGALPYRHYTFILHLANSWGGLEHRNSVTNLVDRWTFHPRRSYERFLGLQSHEFFHVWNVKRIRPAPLGPFDYRRENYTRQLWAVEGITSYYDNLMLARAGLITAERYFELVADDIVALQSKPGRTVHSLAESSFDAWIKFYRPDEHTNNSTISYYLKGSLVALLLDLEIRFRTDGEHSLDDVMRYLYHHYPASDPGIPEPDGYLAAVEAVAGRADGFYHTFFENFIAGTAELEYERAFSWLGITLEWSHKQQARDNTPPAWLGLQCKQEHGRTIVGSVRSDGPACSAGLSAGDELLAFNGMRIDDIRLDARLAECTPGDTVIISLFRRDELLHLPVALTEAPYNNLELKRVERPDALQEGRYRAWLWLDR